MKRKKNTYIFIGICIIGIFGIRHVRDTQTHTPTEYVQHQKVYEHTFPEQISTIDYFPGEFISNDVASIYPRRDAIIQDILVDIWDEVAAWETLAILLNPWVSWEWQSKINIKHTVVSSKNNLLLEAKKVKDAKIAELEQKIQEKRVILEETINNYNSKISQIWDDSTDGSEYQVFLRSLENLQRNLENAEKSKIELLSESKNNITQKEQLLSAKIDEIYNNIIPILYIWNENELHYGKINSYDFSDQFWAKNTMLRNEFINNLQIFHNNFDDLELEKKYNDMLQITHSLIAVLQNTIISVRADEATISMHISDISTYNSALIAQKEILDDAKNMYNVLDVAQKEKIENIELQISKQENEIALLWTKSHSTESEKSLAVSKLSAEIETLQKSKELLIASEDRLIADIENDIIIAKADLNSEYIKSGDYKITSPFSWVISKRGIGVGEKISLHTEAFRISGVETSLSKITKKEIKFYVPENVKENLKLEKEISFYSSDDKNKGFTGSIYRISPEIDEKTFSITVQAKISDEINLPNKSTVRVSLEHKKDVFKVPSNAIYNKEKRKIIYYKKDNGKLWVKDVTIVSDDWEYSLVAGDFDETLQVVITPIFIK